MSAGQDTYLLLRAFVDELARCGMHAACTSPGSRCAPLVLSLAREPRLRCYSHVDERCAGFFALGLAKASAVPVAVTCTSGTAAGELLPAAIEAHEARVPLILLTADRPSELRQNGAGQAVDQLKLFGDAAKWFFEVETDSASPQRLRWIRTLACRAYWTALQGRPGAVHLNFPLRDPLVSDGPPAEDSTGRPDGEPYVRRRTAGGDLPESDRLASDSDTLTRPLSRAEPFPHSAPRPPDRELTRLIARARTGIVVAGRHERADDLGQTAARFAAAVGWPLLADPLSGARAGDAAIAHYDALLRDDAFAARHRPELVLRVGDLPVSKPLRSWLASLDGARQVALDPEGAWQDPDSTLSDSLALDPANALCELAARFAAAKNRPANDHRSPADHQAAPDHETASDHATAPDHEMAPDYETASDHEMAPDYEPAVEAQLADRQPRLSPADPDWLAAWRAADELAAAAILAELAHETISEPRLAAELGVLLPQNATLFVASSMPVRDIETFWPVRQDPPRVLCNRGANGIDGTVSSAFGAAAHARGPVVLLIGDVALAHDIGGLLAAKRLGLPLTIVLVDNAGGGIFDFLPIAHAAIARAPDLQPVPQSPQDIYTRHVATPTGLDFAKAADLYGLAYEHAQTVPGFREAIERALAPETRATIVHVRADRAANVELHRRVWDAVSTALADH
ncbi:MAG TPA: 2-succinyl-5-enolpyruvyl-6-hydroxy-3-cyclohexene-1-carboxylic-acid synthase [Solirubrobacteraceae bacterium]|nr:2-succinyl-5-enolpyruvyl-6-hydroxy-3-cyclohexene-1-carboxylic-acid synthase [Solirubrobacteraceae bacterium]